MNNIKKENVFTNEEILLIKNIIDKELQTRPYVNWDDNSMGRVSKEKIIKIKKNALGRLEVGGLTMPKKIVNKVFSIAQELFHVKEYNITMLSDITYVEYNKKYSEGNPVLNVHKDYGQCGLILDYQLDSNTSWDIGIEKDIYSINNNEIIALHPLTYYHWRPFKHWQDNEYVKLIFFEFHVPNMPREEDLSRKDDLIKYAKDYDEKITAMLYNRDGGKNEIH